MHAIILNLITTKANVGLIIDLTSVDNGKYYEKTSIPERITYKKIACRGYKMKDKLIISDFKNSQSQFKFNSNYEKNTVTFQHSIVTQI